MKGMSTKASVALYSLAISAFAIGTTEFVIVGLLPTVAADLQITVTKAGTLISGYAAAIAIGTPIIAALTGRVPKKFFLILLMTLFTLGNLLAAVSNNYQVLMLARVFTAVTHGVFLAIAAVVAASLVPDTKKGTAISIVFTGLTIATIVGVPLGTYIGQHFGWRATFMLIALLGLISLLINIVAIDRIKQDAQGPSFKDMMHLICNRRILMAFVMTCLGFGGTFALFTYLSPILEKVSGFSAESISWLLLLYGVAVAIGNIIGGKIANTHPVKGLRPVFLLQSLVLLLQMWLLFTKQSSILSVFLLGLFAFMRSPGVQAYIVALAEKLCPAAVDIASALNISAFNVGIAAGSLIGGWAVDYLSYLDTAWIGALMSGAAFLLALINYRLDKKQKLF
jgi:predicted MFS family arabinose efflux permease